MNWEDMEVVVVYFNKSWKGWVKIRNGLNSRVSDPKQNRNKNRSELNLPNSKCGCYSFNCDEETARTRNEYKIFV